MADFTMPALGADMDSGTVLEWLVKPGDEVRKGDIVAVVDTAKAAVEVETFTGGVVQEIVVPPGREVPVGTVLATIGEAAPRAPAAGAPPVEVPAAPPPVEVPAAAPPVEEPAAAPPPAVPAGAPAAPQVVRPHHGPVTPLVRKLAAQLHVDLDTVSGSGRRGAITRADVTRAAASTAPSVEERRRGAVSPRARRLATELGVDLSSVSPRPGSTVVHAADVREAAAGTAVTRPTVTAEAPHRAPGPSPIRQATARLMARANREIPHYYLSATIDLAAAIGWLREHNRELPITSRVVPAALLLKATALAARRHPELNGFWVDDAFVPSAAVHLGVAVSLRGGGLMAPAIHDADQLSADDLMARLRDLVTRTRAGRLRRTELADPTITVTNLGDQGVESVHGVIYPPQVALVGFGRVVERPWAVDGMLAVHPVTTATLAADHRATDGFSGARFLDTIDHLLQQPEAL